MKKTSVLFLILVTLFLVACSADEAVKATENNKVEAENIDEEPTENIDNFDSDYYCYPSISDQGVEVPNIGVHHNNCDWGYVVGLNIWDGLIYDRQNLAVTLSENSCANYVPNGDVIEIYFEQTPNNIEMLDVLIDDEGHTKFNIDDSDKVDIELENNMLKFTVEPPVKTALSSSMEYRKPKSAVRVVKITCDYGTNQCEYGFIFCSDPFGINEPPTILPQDIDVKPAEYTYNQDMGACPLELIYASDEKVIVWGYMGLFIYDLKNQALSHTLDLSYIDSNHVQGSVHSSLNVSSDGELVYIRTFDLSSEPNTMYIYNLRQNKLTQVVPTNIADKYVQSYSTSDLGFWGENDEYFTGINAFELDNDKYGYLRFYGMLLRDVKYYDGNIEYSLFDYASYINGANNDLYSQLTLIANDDIDGYMFEKYEAGELVKSVLVDDISTNLSSIKCEFNEIIDGYMLSRGKADFYRLNDIRIVLIDNTLTLDIDNIIYKYTLDENYVNAFNSIFRVSNFD